MNKFITLLLCTVFVLSCKNESLQTVNKVSPEEMKTILNMDGIQLVDVRSPEELKKEGFIEGAQNIDFNSSTFDDDIKKLDKNKPVLVYCKSGGRSSACVEKMKQAGFVKIYELDGGFSKWKHEGYHIEK